MNKLTLVFILVLAPLLMVACNTTEGPKLSLPSCDEVAKGNCCDDGTIRTLGFETPLVMQTGVGLGCRENSDYPITAPECGTGQEGFCCKDEALHSDAGYAIGPGIRIPCVTSYAPCGEEHGRCYCRGDGIWINKQGVPAQMDGKPIFCAAP